MEIIAGGELAKQEPLLSRHSFGGASTVNDPTLGFFLNLWIFPNLPRPLTLSHSQAFQTFLYPSHCSFNREAPCEKALLHNQLQPFTCRMVVSESPKHSKCSCLCFIVQSCTRLPSLTSKTSTRRPMVKRKRGSVALRFAPIVPPGTVVADRAKPLIKFCFCSD